MDKDDVEKTIAEDLVVTKYKMAGELVNSKNFYFEFKLQFLFIVKKF